MLYEIYKQSNHTLLFKSNCIQLYVDNVSNKATYESTYDSRSKTYPPRKTENFDTENIFFSFYKLKK